MTKKTKKPSRSKLIHKLDSIFSLFIRLRGSDTNGICSCFTCGLHGNYKTMQCGHFISRAVYNYRWDETNCEIQCYVCNCIKSGNYKVYTLKMIDKYGREKIESMMNNKQIQKKTTQEIIEKIEYYTNLVKNMENTLKISA